MSLMTIPGSHNSHHSKVRLLGTLIARFSVALNVLTTIPVIRYKAGVAHIIVGYLPLPSLKAPTPMPSESPAPIGEVSPTNGVPSTPVEGGSSVPTPTSVLSEASIAGKAPTPQASTTSLPVNVITVLADIVSYLFSAQAKVVFVRINHAYMDANVLARYMALVMGQSRTVSYTFNQVALTLIKYIAMVGRSTRIDRETGLNTYLSGIKVQVSGRLTTEPTRPRQTVSELSIGSFRSNRIQAGSYTITNDKGSVTVKVWLAMTTL